MVLPLGRHSDRQPGHWHRSRQENGNTEVSEAIADVAGNGAKIDLITISDEPKPWRDSLLNGKSILLETAYMGLLGTPAAFRHCEKRTEASASPFYSFQL